MIVLQNPGLLELDLIKSIGVNIKETDNPYGMFGTGLKYAISVFLREGLNFDLFIGTNKFEFYTEKKTIRGKEFKYCAMKGPQDSIILCYTTEFGKNWSLWQAYRELHSNCLDEEGVVYPSGSKHTPEPKEGYTTFYIHDEGKINIEEVFLTTQSSDLLYVDDDIEISRGTSHYIFYKGVRAKTLSSSSKFTYNILKDCYLTEDRLLCFDSDVKRVVNNAVVRMASNCPGLTKEILNSECRFERELNMDYNTTIAPTPEFLEAIKGVKKENNPLSYGVSEYIKKYEKPKELTPEEKLNEFLEDLQGLCEDYDVYISRSTSLGFLSLELSDGILKEYDPED